MVKDYRTKVDKNILLRRVQANPSNEGTGEKRVSH